jgi:hypothetical protein
MKLDNDPRITAGPNFMYSLLAFLRKVVQAVNGFDDTATAQTQRIADLEAQVIDLEARVTALETP